MNPLTFADEFPGRPLRFPYMARPWLGQHRHLELQGFHPDPLGRHFLTGAQGKEDPHSVPLEYPGSEQSARGV